MSRPAVYPLTVIIGDTETLRITITDSAGVPVNIAGRAYNSQVRSTPESSAVLGTFSCVVTDAANGVVTCTLPADVTATFTPQMAVYDVQETQGTSVTTLVGGPVEILSDVTR